MLRTECELDEKVPPSPPETLVQGLGPLDSPLSIGFDAQCMSHVAMACPACLHTLMLRLDCTHRTCFEIDVLTHSDESQEGLEGKFGPLALSTPLRPCHLRLRGADLLPGGTPLRGPHSQSK